MEWIVTCFLLFSGISNTDFAELSTSPMDYSSISETYASSLVEDYNKVLKEAYGENIPETKAGISAVGMIIVKEEHSNHLSTLTLKARIEKEDTTPPEYITFKIQSKKSIELPALMESARIVYIGNQLIVDNIKSNVALNFLIESEKVTNKTPFLTTISTKKITVKRGNFVEINI